MTFTEENEYYTVNCDKALWASDMQHKEYQDLTSGLLKDADWFIETNDAVMIVEYKNGTVFASEQRFEPQSDKHVDSVAKKYYDSLHYLTLMQKDKAKKYIYIVEYPNSDTVSRKMLRNRIADKLPFRLQNRLSSSVKLIDSFDVVSINEWNEKYPDFPISRTDKPFK